MTTPEDRVAALTERARFAQRDIAELAEQVESGEIDADTAARLEVGYRAELEEAERLLAGIERPPRRSKAGRPAASGQPSAAGSPRNVLIGMLVAMVALTVVIVVAGRGGDEGAAAAPATTQAPEIGSSGDPLADMEAAVAAHPESNEMRLALAGMYFDVGQYLPAMEHYLAVLENAPTPAEESVALARVGWMAYVTDQPETAVEYLNAALAIDPGYGEAKLFLGVVLLYGMEDPEGAIPVLEDVLEFPDLPEQLRPDVENMLAEARAQGGGEG